MLLLLLPEWSPAPSPSTETVAHLNWYTFLVCASQTLPVVRPRRRVLCLAAAALLAAAACGLLVAARVLPTRAVWVPVLGTLLVVLAGGIAEGVLLRRGESALSAVSQSRLVGFTTGVVIALSVLLSRLLLLP